MKYWWAIMVVWPGVVSAMEMPIVRVDLDNTTVPVGESTELRLTVLVPTWFLQPPVYPDFELADAITRLPPDSSHPTSERVGRATWSGIVRVYRIYPLTAATYRISGETIRVTWANPGGEPRRQAVAVPDVDFRAVVPDGARGLDPYLAGTRLRLSAETEGSIDALKAGDAVAIRYTLELESMPAIFIPPLAPELELDGVSVYADAPEIDDGPPAKRSERINLVFNAGGRFSVPAVSIDYWNTELRRVETVTAAPLTLTVSGSPVEAVAGDRELTGVPWRSFIPAAALSIIVAAFIWRRGPGWRESLKRARRQREASESYAFAELLAALRSGRADLGYRWLLAWTDRLEQPLDSREFARRYGGNALPSALEEWRAGLFSGGSGCSDLNTVAVGLARARKRYLESLKSGARCSVLPPLNPK